jgi:pyrroline-5-carboxylate reductase
MAIVGFIGTGNMGGALARAAAKSGLAEELLLANRSPEKALRLAEGLGGRQVDNQEAAAR